MLLLATLATSAAAQENTPRYQGPEACVGCHFAPRSIHKTDLVMLNESITWLEEGGADPDREPQTLDKHFLAFELLKGELGQQIGQRLYGNPEVTNRAECLSCHAGASKPPEQMINFGVSCESCHGPSSLWEGPHDAPDQWRSKTPAEKLALGMVDVRDPELRARQCFSCHIGDAPQGRVVTHAMYAAGHPPLPSIEVETFANQMPKHWRYLAEKGNFLHRDEYLKANHPDTMHDPAADLPRTKAVIIGGVVALQQSIEFNAALVAQQAEQGYEFAAFDCAACHHDLKPASWRQQRGYAHGRPGRPPMHQWPTALVELGIQQVAGADEAKYGAMHSRLEEHLHGLQAAYVKQPFGDSDAIQAATKQLNAQLQLLLVALKTTRYDQAANQRALARLRAMATAGYPDFHSARQIAWATKMLLAENTVKYPQLWKQPHDAENKGRDDVQAYQQWLTTSWQPAVERADSQFREADQLNSYLQLDLPAGQQYQLEEFLPQSLRAMRLYDPAEFRRRFVELPLE
jgi:hypothetical protein